MTQPRPILLLNDKNLYNVRYRTPLMTLLRARGHPLDSRGLFDSLCRLPRLLAGLLTGGRGLVVSSNLKTNAITLAFTRQPKVVIVNGLGRYRSSRTVRGIMSLLLGLRGNTHAIVQNYADYRYLRRRCPEVTMEWMPGSGGTAKSTGPRDTVVIVQRDPKIAAVASDVVKLLQSQKPAPPLVVVGCTDADQLDRLFGAIVYRSVGYVAPEAIFAQGGTFLQPMGYGEGFPHTLADALVSGMDIYISNLEVLRYGLGRFGATRTPIAPGWSRLVVSEALVQAVHVDTITTRIVDICETLARKV